MSDRLEQISRDYAAGYNNPHRRPVRNLDPAADAEEDVGWLLDEVMRLRKIVAAANAPSDDRRVAVTEAVLKGDL